MSRYTYNKPIVQSNYELALCSLILDVHDPVVNYELALVDACEKRQLKVIKAFVSKGWVKAGCREAEGLMECAQRGYLPGVLYLVSEEGVSVHSRGGYALLLAASRAHPRVVEYIVLMWIGRPTALFMEDALCRAAASGDIECLDLLIRWWCAEGGEDIKRFLPNALESAGQSGHENTLRCLLDIVDSYEDRDAFGPAIIKAEDVVKEWSNCSHLLAVFKEYNDRKRSL